MLMDRIRRIASSQDFAAAAFFLALGAVGLWFSSALTIGTAARMGPGFFPILVFGGLLLTGALILLQTLLANNLPKLTAPVIRPMVCIIGAALIFGITLERFGLVLSVAMLVVVARLAEFPIQPVRTALLAALTAFVSVLIFREGLGLPVQVWP